MKNICSIIAALALTVSVFAQAPEKMSYQAVVRNSSDALVTNQNVGMQISILQGSASGTAVYVETQTPSANVNGLVSLEIGSGTPVTGTFAGINWANGPYFIKTEIDPAGGSSYTIAGTSQLLSVPYALHAKTAATATTATTATSLVGGIDEAYINALEARITALEPTVPSAPTIGTATAGDGQATISFTAPVIDCVSPITSYTATSSPGNITGTLTQSGSGTITVTGLTNGTAYTFTVTATNAIGVSAPSASSNSVTPDAIATIGDVRAGGVVFWVDPADNTHGLVCAIADQSTPILWSNGSYTNTGATATGIGTGAANTTAIIASQGATEINYAAGIARAYAGGGYTDWFLPSKDELNEIYINKTAINTTATANGGTIFTTKYYWSSTEYDYLKAWLQSFYAGNQYYLNKDLPNDSPRVRAVRAF
jgi:hypothetical protein